MRDIETGNSADGNSRNGVESNCEDAASGHAAVPLLPGGAAWENTRELAEAEGAEAERASKRNHSRASTVGHLVDALRGYGGYLDGDASREVGYLEHFLCRGHVGKVQCVAASETVDYIVSGGEDYTMRVWAYDESSAHGTIQKTRTFELCAVLLHDDDREKDRAASEAAGTSGSGSCWSSCCGGDAVEEPVVGVTAVACAGTRGPMLSGTSRGGLFVLMLDFAEEGKEGWITRIDAHKMKINDICVEGGTDTNGQGVLDDAPLCGRPWCFGVACEDGTVTLVKFVDDNFSMTQMKMPCGGSVLKVRFIADIGHERQPDWITWASCTAEAVYLWSGEGELKHTLKNLWTTRNANGELVVETPPESPFTMLAVGNNPNGSLMFAGNAGNPDKQAPSSVSVWSIEHGRVCDGYGRTDAKGFSPEVPLLTYKHCGDRLDLDRSGYSTDFAVDVRSDYQVAMWNLQGVPPHRLAISPRGPVNRLVCPRSGFDHIQLQLTHRSKVMHMCTAEDPDDAGGPCLIVGCEDGSAVAWDLEGVDQGEISAEMRSLHAHELMIPLALWLLTFFQVVSFAFGPSIKWRKEVQKPMHITQKLAFIEVDVVLTCPATLLFWAEIAGCVVSMSLYLLFTITPAQELVNWVARKLQSTNAFKVGKSGLHNPAVMITSAMSLVQRAIHFFLLLSSTIFVVPIFKKCAMALDCVHAGKSPPKYEFILFHIFFGDNVPLPEEEAPFLQSVPAVKCFTGSHRRLCIALFLLVPCYLIALIPYAVVEGDSNYVSVAKLWGGLSQTIRKFMFMSNVSENYWIESAMRKATVVNLGFVHPHPDNIFVTRVVELFAKAALPVIVIETTSYARLQMYMVTVVGFIMLVVTFACPPKVDRKLCRIEQGLRVFTFCTMCCGCLTVELEKDSVVPLIVLGVSAVIVPLFFLALAVREPVSPVNVQQCSTSSIPAKSASEAVIIDGAQRSLRFKG
eukprot:CAMPEP_0115375502 /NCGR_PEP_ID=MMETSP0271-20121206/2492_1 /TAXON_ID=71861 /ORGANISM="Scrippsiella trochoidea, Strain CCMP3099" /LENGTH=966 /DNA_ID=CAMNT_0002798561 /DNA_START=57 /DNA_END=2953 /DNA_ORIENTATION=-